MAHRANRRRVTSGCAYAHFRPELVAHPMSQNTPPSDPAPTPAESFDALYAHAAPALVHQAYLLTGARRHAFDSVEHAFQRAWESWPEVAADPDPVGWVRARTHDYALAPWHRFPGRLRRPETPPADPAHRALLALPPLHRRTLLLCDGLGLDAEAAAAETAASVPATTSRLHHARTALGQRVPDLADPEAQREWLGDLVATVSTATLPLARSVRTGSERRLRTLTRTVYGVVLLLVCAVLLAALTAASPRPEPAPRDRVVDGAPHSDGHRFPRPR
ncbi:MULTISPECIES: sigma-70 family RNA polymerase sigma factor [Streptomyces]|uniref:Sigma-70 family RNA polymerase sigma factor n=1 Tax=Streptomyces sudanensis TaxID=436397 RepID=A0ABY4TEV1_9ACTN|nr:MULTISPECIES: sigma-70 family RNA polymerase sigma factor [Streptomyces]URN17469.1 sigma-70 family RNA polymerase sigma factor [Streptomyces sudanensis]